MAAKDRTPELLRKYMDLDNIVPELDSQLLTDIASKVIDDTTKDEESRYEWKTQYNEAMKIAKQIVTGKHTPWQGAAEVKYPLILTACIQYNARMYPEVIQGTKVVNIVDMNPEADEVEEDRNDRISNHMSWQLLEQVDNWKSDTDKLLMVLPLAGVVFRKTRFDSIDKIPAVDLCMPSDIVIHNDISSLEKAERVTHILHLTNNELLEQMRAGIYKEYPLEELESGLEEDNTIEDSRAPADTSKNPDLHEVYEQHTYWDLDDDGYAEPYIITVHRNSSVVLRMVARYTKDSLIYGGKDGKLVKIKADSYFTDYHFMPSPDGTFYSMGFGKYLYPINETVNTILNQTLDAATLQNLGGGFITESVRMVNQEVKFKIGEYKKVKVPNGTTLAQNIWSPPTPGPSPALLELLQLLIKSGEEIASISDVMQGQSPVANASPTTTMITIEQGSKVYSAMLNRLYSSFKKEYEKLFELNKRYLDIEEKFALDRKANYVTLEDYKIADVKVFPVADPSIASDAHRMAKGQALMQILGDPGVDKREILKRYLAAIKIQHPEQILPEPDPNAPPPIQEQVAEAQLKKINMETADLMMQRELEALRLHLDEMILQINAAYKGGQLTSEKIEAVAKLAQTDAIVGEKNVAQAERQANLMQQTIGMPQMPAIEQRLSAVETSLGGQLGISPPSQPAQQPGGPQPSPEGQVSPGGAPDSLAPQQQPDAGGQPPAPQEQPPEEAGQPPEGGQQ